MGMASVYYHVLMDTMLIGIRVGPVLNVQYNVRFVAMIIRNKCRYVICVR